MNNVVDISSRKPHIHGEVQCVVCKHKWMAVALAGTFTLQCPACELYRGYFIGHCESSKGTHVFTCNYCTGQVFELVQNRGAMCVGCGFMHSWKDIPSG